MRTIMIAAALLATTAAVPAMAQDAGTFTGPRVEGLIGYDALQSGGDGGDETIDGVSYGIAAGYDYSLGSIVLGIEGEFADSSAKHTSTDIVDGFSSRISTGRDLYVGGRVGFPVTPSTLLYAKGGYTNTKINTSFDDGDERLKFGSNVDGFRLGAGVEQAFGPNLYGKVEYRYSNYSNLKLSEDLGGSETDIDLDRHQVMAGLGFRF